MRSLLPALVFLTAALPVRALAQAADGRPDSPQSSEHASSVAQDVESQRYVGSAGSVAFGAGSPIADFADLRIEGGGRAVKVSGTLVDAGHARLEASAAFLSYSGFNDQAMLPWIMANPQLVATAALNRTTEGHVSVGVLHAIQSGSLMGAVNDEASPATIDPVLRGQLWNTISVGASKRLSKAVSVRAELCFILRGAEIDWNDPATGAPVVLTVGITFL